MPKLPPNPALLRLAEVLGVDAVRELVQLFLGDTPGLLRKLDAEDGEERKRAAHSLRSSAELVGALDFARSVAALEPKLDGAADPAALAAIGREFDRASASLRAFAA